MRITQKVLEAKIETLNRLSGNPTEYRAKNQDGTMGKINIGHYHLGAAYGGYALYQTANNCGGIRHVGSSGYGTAKELALVIDGMLSAYYAQQF